MPVLHPAPAMNPFPGTSFIPLAGPSRGTEKSSVWTVTIEPGPLPAPHRLTTEEVFLVLAGSAEVALGGETLTAAEGDAIVVPADTDFAVRSAGDAPLRLVCVLPVGGQVRTADGLFTPPWAA